MTLTYIQGAEQHYLVAINPKFEPIKIDDQNFLIGKVVEVRSTL